MTSIFQLECGTARRLVHAAADGELDAAGRAHLEAHVAACGDCRAFRVELDELRAALARIDDPVLPAEDLEAVFARTVGTAGAPATAAAPARPLRRWTSGWAAAAVAAAFLGLALLAPWALRAPSEAPPSEAELARAAHDVRYVFQLTDRAVSASGRAAFDEAVGRGVRPALRRVPVLDSPITGGITP